MFGQMSMGGGPGFLGPQPMVTPSTGGLELFGVSSSLPAGAGPLVLPKVVSDMSHGGVT